MQFMLILDPEVVKTFQPWWVARAYMLAWLGPKFLKEADAAYRTAIGLSTQQKIRDYLEGVRAALK